MATSDERYDNDLQMFRERPQPIDLAKVRFLRWLVERGELEHEPFGLPSGDLVDELREAA